MVQSFEIKLVLVGAAAGQGLGRQGLARATTTTMISSGLFGQGQEGLEERQFQVVAEIGVTKTSELVETVQQVQGLAAKLCSVRVLLQVVRVKGELEDLVAKLCLIMAQLLAIRVKGELEGVVVVGSIGVEYLNLRVAEKAIEMVEVERKYLPTV